MNNQHGTPMPQADLTGAGWRKSSHSSGEGACVEIAVVGDVIAVRDSKDASGSLLAFSPDEFGALVKEIVDGGFARS